MSWSAFTRKVLLKDKGKKGRIWKAYRADIPFLVKEYLPLNGEIPSWAAAEIRFGQKAPVLSGLIDVFSETDAVVLVYTWLDGINLQDLKDTQKFWHKKLPLEELFPQMSAALQRFHESGYLHLDIRPSNFMLLHHSRSVQLIDFGSVRTPAELKAGNIPEFGMHYAAPELLLRRGAMIDRRTDYYGLGLSMAYLISGKHPFLSTHPELIKSRMLSEALDPADFGKWGEYICRLSAKSQFPKPPAQLPAETIDQILETGLNSRPLSL